MEGCCTAKCKATKLLIMGILLILVRVYFPNWDLFRIIGILLIIKAVVVFFMPACPWCKPKAGRKR